MATSYEDIALITGALDDYQRNLERRRQGIDTSGFGSKSNPYKSYTVFEDGAEVEKVLTPTEFRQMYPQGAPKKGITEIKKHTYTDPVTEQQNEILYTDKSMNTYFAQNDLPYNQENLNKFFSDSSKGTIKAVGAYDKNELEVLQQELFSSYAYEDEGGNMIASNPVTSDEAKLVLDMKTILDDYKDYSKDDMILSSENIKRRYEEILGLYNQYIEDRADEKGSGRGSYIKPSKLKSLRNKLDDLENRWTTVKTDSFKGGKAEGVVYAGFDKPAPDNILQKNLVGKDKAEYDKYKDFNDKLDDMGAITIKIGGEDVTFRAIDLRLQSDEQFNKWLTKNITDPEKKDKINDKRDFFNMPEVSSYLASSLTNWGNYAGLMERWGWWETPGAKPPASQPDLVKKYSGLKEEAKEEINPDDPYGLNLGGESSNPLNLNFK